MTSRTRWTLARLTITAVGCALWACNPSPPVAPEDEPTPDAATSDTTTDSGDDVDEDSNTTDELDDIPVDEDTSTDDADTSPSDTEPDDIEPDVTESGWWSDIDNTCVPSGSLDGREVQRPPGTPPVAPGSPPTLAWQRRNLCAGLGLADPDMELPDYEASPLAMGQVTLDGVEREVVVTTFELSTRTSPWGYIEAIAVLDANNGDTLKCWPLPYQHFVKATDPILLPDVGRVLLSASRPHPSPDSESLLLSLDLNDDSHVAYRAPGPETSSARYFAASDEVAIARFDQRHVAVANDRETMYWTTPRQDHRRILATDNRMVGIADDRLAVIDHCGTTDTPLFEVDARIYDSIELGDTFVLMTDEGLEFWSGAGERLSVVEPCADVVTQDEQHIVCQRIANYQTIELTVYSLDGTPTRTFQYVTDGGVMPWVVASANGSLVVASSPEKDQDTGRNLAIHVVTPDDGVESLELIEPEDQHYTSHLVGRPVLSPDGMLVLNHWGRVYGIQTGVPGLAGGGYPRGYLGGNENRGYVRPLDVP